VSDRVGGLAPEQSVAYPPEWLVGREKEQEAICQAIRDGVRVVYIEGEGGIGKTRLLEEAERFIGDLPFPYIVLDIVDFYDTAMHGSLALEEALARQMQERAGEGAVLETFFSVLERYRVGAVTEDDVHAAFTEAFNAWAGERRAVLRFDTAEFLEYGQDAPEVLEECEVFGEEVPAVTWLQERLPQLERATAVIAARPTRALREQLEGAYSEGLWTYLSLITLSLEEARQYFRASEYGREVDEEMVERIWLLSDGRPIMLSLAIDWLASGVRVDEIYDVDIQELHRLKEQGGGEWGDRRLGFERALVGKIRLLSTPMDAAVYYAARARKGFTAEMLRRALAEVSPWRIELTPEEARDLLQSLAELSFVKHPHGARPGWFFLHDEMYDLLDRHVWQSDYPTYTHQAETAAFLAEQIYGEEDGEGLVAEAAERVKKAETHVELLEARRQLDILRTEQLFYWLEADPIRGYRLYDRLDTQAVSQRRREWDDMLRIEVLRFMRTLTERARQAGLAKGFDPQSGELIIADFINQDARAHWVHRFLARGNPEKAERIARGLMDVHPDWAGFWKARVLVTQGAALVRMGRPESTMVLREALQILEQPQLDGDAWAIRHYAATAYLYLGLQARAEWNMERAVGVYEKAHELFDQNDEPIAAARALNNLAYILVKQGKYQEAVNSAQEAINVRDQFGDVIGTGLSLNTLAIAVDRAGNHMRAWRHTRDALKHLQRAKEAGYPGLDREIAMIHINLGRIQRHKARREQTHLATRIESDWNGAAEHLEKAKDLEGSLEPYYRFDLYNQLGLLYSNWGNWIVTRKPAETERYHKLMELGSTYFEMADCFAEEHGLVVDQADNLEDWAWVFHLRRAYREITGDDADAAMLRRGVFDRLDRAEKLALKSIDDKKRPGLQAYYILGSVHHQRGRFIHKFEDNIGEALKEYALSVAYYDHFALNPLDPLERRERVLQHIRSTLEDVSERLPVEQLERMMSEMSETVEKEGLPSAALDWFDDLVADLSLE
jgi:tetratricopeptide (TPR) repeat protein